MYLYIILIKLGTYLASAPKSKIICMNYRQRAEAFIKNYWNNNKPLRFSGKSEEIFYHPIEDKYKMQIQKMEQYFYHVRKVIRKNIEKEEFIRN